MKREDKRFAEEVERQVRALDEGRSGFRALPKDILMTALRRYRKGTLKAEEQRLAARDVKAHLCRTMVDCEIGVSDVKSLSKARNASGLTIYSAQTAPMERRVFVGAYFHTFLFRHDELWFVSSVEPAATTTHLHERILRRSREAYPNFTAAQKRLSAFWPLLVEAGQHLRRTRGTAQAVRYFAHPWADGLVLGQMQKLEGAAFGMPYIVRFRSGLGLEQPLQDAYTRDGERLLVNVKTFIGPDEMKHGQLTLAARLNDVLDRYQDVVEYLRLRWQIGLGFDDEVSSEIMRVMRFGRVEDDRIAGAVAEIVGITESEEWKREAEFNRRSQQRYQANATGRASLDLDLTESAP